MLKESFGSSGMLTPSTEAAGRVRLRHLQRLVYADGSRARNRSGLGRARFRPPRGVRERVNRPFPKIKPNQYAGKSGDPQEHTRVGANNMVNIEADTRPRDIASNG